MERDPHSRPRVRLDVSGLKVDFLIVSGSSHTIVTENVYNCIPCIVPLAPTSCEMATATGGPFQVSGVCVLKINDINVECLVTPEKIECILGRFSDVL